MKICEGINQKYKGYVLSLLSFSPPTLHARTLLLRYTDSPDIRVVLQQAEPAILLDPLERLLHLPALASPVQVVAIHNLLHAQFKQGPRGQGISTFNSTRRREGIARATASLVLDLGHCTFLHPINRGRQRGVIDMDKGQLVGVGTSESRSHTTSNTTAQGPRDSSCAPFLICMLSS